MINETPARNGNYFRTKAVDSRQWKIERSGMTFAKPDSSIKRCVDSLSPGCEFSEMKLTVGGGFGGCRFGCVEVGRGGFGNFVEGVCDGKNEVANAFAGGGGNCMEGEIALLAEVAELFQACAVCGGVEFGRHDHHWLFTEACAESEQLAADNFKRSDRIGVGEIAGVDQVNEDASALDVAQKADAETSTFVRAFNQAR